MNCCLAMQLKKQQTRKMPTQTKTNEVMINEVLIALNIIIGEECLNC